MPLLKKFYPRSPQPFIGTSLGDNYIAKLADLNRLIDEIEELYANTPPGSGLSTVAVNSPLSGTGTIGDPLTLNGSVAGTNFNVAVSGSGITIGKNSGGFSGGTQTIQTNDVLKIQVQNVPNGLNWEGEHSTSTAYSLNDVVYKTVGGIYYTYWCYSPSGVPIGQALPPAGEVFNTFWAQLGVQGPAGISGATWTGGATVPSSGTGEVGDFHLITSGVNQGDIYKKTGAGWGSALFNTKGATGANGTNGALWYSGVGVPSTSLGAINDYYLKSDDGIVYKKTGASTWASQLFSLKGATGAASTVAGPQGPAGTKGDTNTIVKLFARSVSAVAPSVSTSGTTSYTFATGAVSNQPSGWSISIPTTPTTSKYIWEIQAVANSTGTVASIANNTWSSPSLLAQPGDQGSNGTAAGFGTPTASALPSGNTPTVTASGPDTAKVFAFGIPAGAAGAAGPSGKSVLNGTTVPNSGTGTEGDFYIKTDTNQIFGPKTSGGSWGSPTNLVGPAGVAKTVIAFTVDGYGAPITLPTTKTVFSVTLPYTGGVVYDSLTVTSDLAGGAAGVATLTVSGGSGTNFTATLNNTTTAAITGGPSKTFTAGQTITFTLSTTASMLATYLYVSLSGTRS
jgi:hypothetical protein